MRMARILSTIALSGTLSLALAAPAMAQTPAPSVLSVDGVLHPNDPVDGEGRHRRVRNITLQAGEGVDISVASDAFDTMLRVTGPNGFSAENDDAEGEGLNSRLRFRVLATGTYYIEVTTYSAGETGEYHLEVHRGVSIDEDPSSATGNGADVVQQPDSQVTAAPQGYGGYDPNVGIYAGTYVGQQPNVPPPTTYPGYGQPVQGNWGAPQYPGYVPQGYAQPGYVPPQGYAAPQGYVGYAPQYPGYVPQPQSYAQPGYANPGAWSQDPSAQPTQPAQPGIGGTGTVYGIFIGISDYAGSNTNLDYTAQDARDLSDAFLRARLIRAGNAIVLTDAEATPSNVRRAFQTIAMRATENDTVVFFHDGHGNSNTIALRGGSMSSQELSSLMDRVHGQHLVVLDSCHSGGFASIIQGRPNRTGLFSSRADETSYVASEVRAGGWLAYFMIQAVRGDVNGGPDGLQVNELASYVQRGYNQRVGGRQHLVVATGINGAQATLWGAAPRNSNVASARR